MVWPNASAKVDPFYQQKQCTMPRNSESKDLNAMTLGYNDLKRDITRCVGNSFPVFSLNKTKQNTNKTKFIYSKYWPYDSIHFVHLSGNLWMPFQKNSLSFEINHSSIHFLTSSKSAKCCSASACPIDAKRW